MDKTTILIVEDHTLVRETWSFIINSHPKFAVIGECGSGEEGIELARKLHPDIVIMDVYLPGISGIEATEQIHRIAPHTKIIGVSLQVQPIVVRKLMHKGAVGYVTKNSSRQEMFKALTEIQQGKKYVCEEIKNIWSEQVMSGEDQRPVLRSLSARELEVIGYLKKGYVSKQIAEALFISIKTVEVHRYNILKKLKLKNVAALVNFINQNRLELE